MSNKQVEERLRSAGLINMSVDSCRIGLETLANVQRFAALMGFGKLMQ